MQLSVYSISAQIIEPFRLENIFKATESNL